MTTTEKVKSINEIARKNGLALNKKFNDSYLAAHSMFEGPQALADRVIDGMWEMCVHGINNGFDGTCERAVDGLSDIVVQLTEIGNEQIGKLDKLRTKADGLLQKELAARKAVINVTEPVAKCAASCITAIDTMISLRESGQGLVNVSEAQFELLRQSRDVIEQITATLADVGDTSSVAAQAKADAAVKAMREWRDECASNILTQSSLATLKSALDTVTEWTKLSVEVTRKSRVKEQHAYKDNDDLAAIVSGKESLEKLDTFLTRMATEKADIAALRAQIDERAKLKREQKDALEAEISAIPQKKQELVAAYQNGEIDLQTADRKIKELAAKEDDLLYEVGRLDSEQQGPDYFSVSLEQRETIYNELYGVIATLEMYKSDLVMLSDIICDVDFKSLIDMLGGRLTSSGQKAAIQSIHNIISGIKIKIDDNQETIARLHSERGVRARVADVPETDRASVIERERQKRQLDSGSLSPELAALFGDPVPQTGEKLEQKPAAKRSVSLTDDDR